MRRKILLGMTSIMAISAWNAFAVDHEAPHNMEKCVVVKDGKGMIKEGKGDCKTAEHDCSGKSIAGNPHEWIYVPSGKCADINAGKSAGLSDELKNKIEW